MKLKRFRKNHKPATKAHNSVVRALYVACKSLDYACAEIVLKPTTLNHSNNRFPTTSTSSNRLGQLINIVAAINVPTCN